MENLGGKARATFKEGPLTWAVPRILVMDGSEHLRTMLSHLLSFYGYEATIVAEGGEALTRFLQAAEANRPFDAVILDRSVMHGLDALETIERLRAVDPQVRAIISSTFLCGPTNFYRQYGFLGVLAKPFTSLELQQTITSVLAHQQF